MSDQTVFVGTKGSVTAINKSDGREIWRTALKGASYVMLAFDGNQIYAHTGGHLFCLDKISGEILWENDLPGLGYGLATLLVEGGYTDPALLVRTAQIADNRKRDGN